MVEIRPVLSAVIAATFVAVAVLAPRTEPTVGPEEVASVLEQSWSSAGLTGIVDVTIHSRSGAERQRVFDVDRDGDTWFIEALEPSDVAGVRFVFGPDH